MTFDVMPGMWSVWRLYLGELIDYVPLAFISGVQLLMLFYIIVVSKKNRYSSYIWYLILTAVLCISYTWLKDPYEKMRIFEYFLLSLIFFKVFHYQIEGRRVYVISAFATIAVAVIDEYLHYLIVYEPLSLPYIRAEVTISILAQISVALIFKPRFPTWKVNVNTKRELLAQQAKWLKKKKAIYNK
jgi:hypothetical protein